MDPTRFPPSDPRSLEYITQATEALQQAAARLMQLDGQRAEQQRQKRDVERGLEEVRSRLRLDLANETDEKGKPLHSNETARKEALSHALHKDAQASALQKALDDADSRLDRITVDIEDVSRRRSDRHTILRAASYWLKFHSIERH